MEQAINSFLQHLIVEKGFSRNTSEAYRNDLTQFWDYLQEHKKVGVNGDSPWQLVNLDLLNQYISNLRGQKGYRETTTARKVASLKSFFGFLAENGTVAEDPTQSLGSPRVGRSLPGYWTWLPKQGPMKDIATPLFWNCSTPRACGSVNWCR